MLGQWIVTATHRQDRTFLPPAEYCPLCPTRSDEFATEVPASSYDIVLFENRFPSLQTPPPEAALQSAGLFTVAPAVGQCEVVLYTHEHNLTFAQLPQQRIENLISVWAERTEVLGGREGIEYVFVIEQEIAQSAAYSRENGCCLLCDLVGLFDRSFPYVMAVHQAPEDSAQMLREASQPL